MSAPFEGTSWTPLVLVLLYRTAGIAVGISIAAQSHCNT